jgi:hypothetical protein
MLRRMPVHGARLRLAVRLLAVAIVVVAIIGVEGMNVALVLAPALALGLPLLFKRYVGERVIRRLARPALAAPVVRSRALPRAPRSLGARVAALAVPGSGRAPPAIALL